MAILFSKEKKKNLYLLIAIGALLVGLIIFWIFYLNRAKAPIIEEIGEGVSREQRIEINFQALENELFKQLQPFEFIAGTSTARFGRDNPFAPYTTPTPTPNL